MQTKKSMVINNHTSELLLNTSFRARTNIHMTMDCDDDDDKDEDEHDDDNHYYHRRCCRQRWCHGHGHGHGRCQMMWQHYYSWCCCWWCQLLLLFPLLLGWQRLDNWHYNVTSFILSPQIPTTTKPTSIGINYVGRTRTRTRTRRRRRNIKSHAVIGRRIFTTTHATTDMNMNMNMNIDNDIAMDSDSDSDNDSGGRITTSNTRRPSSTSTLLIDPLLLSSTELGLSSIGTSKELEDISKSIQVWRYALSKGRLPLDREFKEKEKVDEVDNVEVSRRRSNGQNSTNLSSSFSNYWPPPPLYKEVYNVMVELQLPRLTQRHPSLIPILLRSLVRYTIQYKHKIQELASRDDDDDDDDDDESMMQKTIAVKDISRSFYREYANAANGISILDGLFGQNHGLFDNNNHINKVEDNIDSDDDAITTETDDEDDEADDVDDDGLSTTTTSTSAGGFGIDDGIWTHSGWTQIPSLQSQLERMSELQELVKNLGRRPITAGNDRMDKFLPRTPYNDGMVGAIVDPTVRSSIDGITLSSNLAEMLPSEAVLLVRQQQQQQKAEENAAISQSSTKQGSVTTTSTTSTNTTSILDVRRQLFMAKFVESKLLSYQSSGFVDVPSVPKQNRRQRRRRRRHQERLPSAPGGPIIVCLDTSWSMMTGTREQLSKAVVLACVTQAHRQGRECHVVAFSTSRNIMDSGVITANRQGIRRLLDFLGNSFGGGTDVTGALKHTIRMLTNSSDHDSNDTTMMTEVESADILLISDGEIPDPPVPIDVMDDLDRLKSNKGVELHGLLVGKSESIPMSKLCGDDRVYDFLSKYDGIASLVGSTAAPRSTTPPTTTNEVTATTNSLYQMYERKNNKNKNRFRMALYAARRSFDEYDYNEDDGYDGNVRSRKQWNKSNKIPKSRRQQQYFDDEDNDALSASETYSTPAETASFTSVFSFDDQVSEETRKVKEHAVQARVNASWTRSHLDKERGENGSCWKYHQALQNAVAQVEDGLIEREEDARLVVLAMVAKEHILLLGQPGTAKSVLGLRLSLLCNGLFFQRLLTRFTTPEELFGPLSLRSLENDEYRRVTDGFLPTAEIAFLDEIFKANSAILNTLLTILNERKFDNAGTRQVCPIRTVVGASNELPENDELEALFDRFLIRKEVRPVSDDGLIDLLSMESPGSLKCDDDGPAGCEIHELDEIIESLNKAADSVVMDVDACILMKNLRIYLRDKHDIEISDRRLVKTSRLLKICAASEGRNKVDAVDFLITQHCFWDEPEQRDVIRDWLWNNLTPLQGSGGTSVDQLRFILNNLQRDTIGYLKGGKPIGITSSIESLREECNRVAKIVDQQRNSLERHLELIKSNDFTWVDPNDVDAMKQLLVPNGEKLLAEVENVAEAAHALRLALASGADEIVSDDTRIHVIESLWDTQSNVDDVESEFTYDELHTMSLKEAKRKYDGETLRRWKTARKRLN